MHVQEYYLCGDKVIGIFNFLSSSEVIVSFTVNLPNNMFQTGLTFNKFCDWPLAFVSRLAAPVLCSLIGWSSEDMDSVWTLLKGSPYHWSNTRVIATRRTSGRGRFMSNKRPAAYGWQWWSIEGMQGGYLEVIGTLLCLIQLIYWVKSLNNSCCISLLSAKTKGRE